MEKMWFATDFGGLDVFEEREVEVDAPQPGEVTIEVRAAGMNPADYKHVSRQGDRSLLPIKVGYEVSGVIRALGEGTEIASGGGAVGDEVIAYRVSGGYSSAMTVSAEDVFAKPASIGFEEAANLLLAGATAAEMLAVTGVAAGDTIVLHGASGAVGVSVLQQARLIGATVIGTASEANFDAVRRFGGIPVAYGPGLEQRVRAAAADAASEMDAWPAAASGAAVEGADARAGAALAADARPSGIVAGLDAVGTEEATEVSLALVPDRQRIVTIAAAPRAKQHGFIAIGGAMPESAAFRDAARARLIALAADGSLAVPIARTYPLADAKEALRYLSSQHPGGKIALIPER